MAPKIKVPANFGVEHINSPVHGNLLLKLRDGQEIKTNSMIMSYNSPVIDKLTTNLFQSTLEMDDFTKPAVDCFVEALYSGEVDKLEKDIFEEVNKMAHVFDVSWLTKRCLKFYKADVLKFENNSYKEMLFACEIASRAHYNLKDSKYVSCFVKNVTFSGNGKFIFLQRYMAGFSALPKRRIDMSLVIAANDLNMISNFVISYISSTLKCKGLDDNSLYMLQKLDIQKFSCTFSSELNEFTDFLAAITEDSECAEMKAVVEKFVKGRDTEESSSSKEELEVDESSEDVQDSDGWIQCVSNTSYTLSHYEPVQMITNPTQLENQIRVFYTLSGEGGSSDDRILIYRDAKTNQWSYYIGGCTALRVNKQFLNNVPADKFKHWIITKTSTHLKVVCNRVTVLNFNFATDYTPGSENSHQVWLKRCTNIRLVNGHDNLLVLNTGG
ncbi:uncharacterized protein LOC134823202 isoform X2 [Bolinopsis microptera]|uniref:uncharacterized protein LOC134823202 isoform X2 n=1 Tax=Bolinopsis microptera TaxID=2820187 RepID=UPI003078A9E9